MGLSIDKIKQMQTFQSSSSAIQDKEKTVSVFCEDNNSSEKKDTCKKESEKSSSDTMIKIGIGVAAVAAITGLLVWDLKRPNSITKKLVNKIKNFSFKNPFKESIEYAKEAKKIPMENLSGNENGMIEKIGDRIADVFTSPAKHVDKQLIGETAEYAKARLQENTGIISELAQSTTTSDAIKCGIELSGTGPTKISQIIAGDKDMMSKIETTAPDLAKALQKTKAQCSAGRTIEEASQLLSESFPGKGYIVKQQLGAGSIGATYLAENPDGQKFVVKMIKQGISQESLEKEAKIMSNWARNFAKTPEEATKIQSTLDSLYADWTKELDLFKCMESSNILSSGAKRFSVAKVSEVAENGKCLVMDMAEGIQMNKLMEILKDYKLNPEGFGAKYAELIAENPWLSEPGKVIEQLPKTLTKTFDEQLLFIKKGGQTMMHGDPHFGNFFITADSKGRLLPQFVDTDNCVVRTAGQVKDDIQFYLNYFFGNSKKVAEHFVSQTSCSAGEKAKLVEVVAEEIQTKIFSKKCNITNFVKFYDNVNAILKSHGLEINSEQATALKAQLQYMQAIKETSSFAGKGPFDFITVIKDVPKAVFQMATNGINPLSCVTSAIGYFFSNVKQSLSTAAQFIV